MSLISHHELSSQASFSELLTPSPHYSPAHTNVRALALLDPSARQLMSLDTGNPYLGCLWGAQCSLVHIPTSTALLASGDYLDLSKEN